MHILHLNAGNETGGGMHHILRTIGRLKQLTPTPLTLGLLEKKELYNRAIKNNIHTICFNSKHRYTPTPIKKIAAYINDHAITHVHTHGPRANVYMNYIRKHVNVEWITTVHSDPTRDFWEKGLYGQVLAHIHVSALKRATKIISVSHHFKPHLIKSGCDPDKIITIHNGIDYGSQASICAPSPLRQQYGFTDDDFLIVQVARLHKIKGHRQALLALRNITDAYNHVHLLLIGDGPLRKNLTKFAKSLDIEDRVHFFGEQQSVTPFFEMADISLLTSVSESFPYVWLESARAKTPVISTEVGDINYFIGAKQEGWKVRVKDVQHLTNAISEAIELKEQGQLHKIGENLHKKAATHFSLDKCAKEVYNVYNTT